MTDREPEKPTTPDPKPERTGKGKANKDTTPTADEDGRKNNVSLDARRTSEVIGQEGQINKWSGKRGLVN